MATVYNRQNEKSIIAKRKVAILPEKSQNEKYKFFPTLFF